MERMLLAFGIVAVTVGFASAEEDIERWNCFESPFAQDAVLVRLERGPIDGDGTGVGSVSAASFTHAAAFYVAGIDRRWDFGDEFNYSMVVEPDGTAYYYDFTNVEDGGTTSADQIFYCEQP